MKSAESQNDSYPSDYIHPIFIRKKEEYEKELNQKEGKY